MLECPDCKYVLPPDLGAYGTNFTLDCPGCGGLLLFDNGVIHNFHKKLHSEDARWPKDGRGTGVIEF